MKSSDFIDILQHTKHIEVQQMDEVKSIIDEFPYFQSARAIYLKGLKNKGSFKYNQELKTTAAYTTDRSVLFDFITSEDFIQNEISEYIKHNFEHLKDFEIHGAEDISVNKSVIIDDALRQHIKASEPILDPSLFEPKPILPLETNIEIDTQKIEQTPEEKLELGKPLDFDKQEMHSFSEWLKITSFKPIIREEESPQQQTDTLEDPKSDKIKIIDQFIDANPKMPEIKKDGPIYNIAKSKYIDSESLMTETLARIYLEQNNYEKAIEAYKILSLKYPEKSGFFADQIQAIKQLQKTK